MTDRISELVEEYKNMRYLLDLNQDKVVVRKLINKIEEQEKEIDTLNLKISLFAIAIDAHTSRLNELEGD